MYIHICKIWGHPNPRQNENERRKKLRDDPRDIIVPIRMNFEEKEKIKARAAKAGKNLSTFIRNSALRL